jgi:hypothetical protein
VGLVVVVGGSSSSSRSSSSNSSRALFCTVFVCQGVILHLLLMMFVCYLCHTASYWWLPPAPILDYRGTTVPVKFIVPVLHTCVYVLSRMWFSYVVIGMWLSFSVIVVFSEL